MLARIRKSMAEKDQGFTLIELLVVMIIIGILAAIAIPVFLNQRKRAVDSSIKSDLRSIANQLETVYTDSQSYPTTFTTSTAGQVTVGSDVVKTSGTNSFQYIYLRADGTGMTVSTTNQATAAGYCLTGTNTGKATGSFYYNSLTGGITTTACPATT
jgi:prepilin-type N-terminal cleavage/methylation domain-containing protein